MDGGSVAGETLARSLLMVPAPEAEGRAEGAEGAEESSLLSMDLALSDMRLSASAPLPLSSAGMRGPFMEVKPAEMADWDRRDHEGSFGALSRVCCRAGSTTR